MLIGLRLILLLGILGAASALLGYLFTRNPRLLYWAKVISATTLILLVAGAGVLVLARVLFK
ncbi:MAG TPA: hypothetical protein VFV17_06600 [Usitatibacteraceae bacterium]|nr:hypothetical protein [Usitatibacteraceae bacterium]